MPPKFRPQLTSIGGVGWENTTSDAEIAQRVLLTLADRDLICQNRPGRASGHDQEDVPFCVDSALSLRAYFDDLINEVPNRGELTDALQAMRDGFRQFVRSVRRDSSLETLYDALAVLRPFIGEHVLWLAHHHRLDIPERLALVVP